MLRPSKVAPHLYLQAPAPHPAMQLPAATGYGAADRRTSSPEDVVLLVGKHRQPFHVNAQSLMRGSAYFHRILGSASPGAWPSLAIDCEDFIFENMMLLMRYGTFEALPPMSAAEIYQLKKEATFYRINYAEPQAISAVSSSSSSVSDVSGASSPQSPMRSSSPKSTTSISPPQTPQSRRSSGRHHEGVRVACSTPQQGLSELSEFPAQLADPGKMVLITCLDTEKEGIYRCACAGSRVRTTQWALNFHHRHAFCTACGEAPQTSAKHFAEMFLAAAALYISEQGGGAATVKAGKWRIVCDSTCLLRFVRSPGKGADLCGCAAAGGGGREAGPTIWAASSFYSHAFCTSCGEGAEGRVLLSVLLALRYGGAGSGRGSKAGRFTATDLN